MMHKITVPPLQPSTYYEKVVAIERRLPALKRVTIESFKLQQLNTAGFNTVQYSSLKYPGHNGICGSTGSVEFTPSPPEPNGCTWRDTDCYRSIHVSLLQTDAAIQVQIAAPWLCEAERTRTREGIAPSINYHEVGGGGDEEERRPGGL